jgi:uncharacterized protein (DUF169 family)
MNDKALDEIRLLAERLERLLRLHTFPLAVKMLRNETDIPSTAKRPLRDMGHHLDVCQGFAMSRREGETIALLKEDMWCFEPVIGYGIEAPPEFFLQGNNRFPLTAMSQEAGARWAQAFPRLESGHYIGIISSPLKYAGFKPDIFVIYGDPAQLTQLLRAKDCLDGADVKCTLSGHAACVFAVVPLLQGMSCNVVSPCRGDRNFAMAQDGEIIFSARLEMLEGLVGAIEYLADQGSGFPSKPLYSQEHELPLNYLEIGKMLGMEFDT